MIRHATAAILLVGFLLQPLSGMMGMTDAMFVPMMIEHHQHGIEMARLEEERGSAASVKALAAKIRQSQEKELAELKAHAEHVVKGTSGHAEHDKMMEQQSQSMMAKLKSASGAALDHAFLEQMAKHHEGAIAMTEGPLPLLWAPPEPDHRKRGDDVQFRLGYRKRTQAEARQLVNVRSFGSDHGAAIY